MKKFFISFAMFMALSVMPVSAQSATPKVIPSVSSLICTPKQFRYEAQSSLVTISEDESSANVYDAKLDLARSFTLQLNTTPIFDVLQQYVNGQWVDMRESSAIYDRGYMDYYDYDESDEGDNCDFTQTLFNNDEKYEYIVPVVDPNAEEVRSEDDYNGDGVPDYRSVRRGVITGFKVINEDGTVLTTLEGKNSNSSLKVCKYGNKFYLITNSLPEYSTSSTFNFYAIDKGASSVKLVKRIQAAPDRIFTLDGREHSEFQHGLNIINGQKVIVK